MVDTPNVSGSLASDKKKYNIYIACYCPSTFVFSHDFLVLNYRLEIRTADCRLEDMTANHTQPSTSYPCEDYDTTENVGLLEELQKVNYILISSTVLLLKPITVTVNPLLSAPLSNKPPFPSHLLFFNNK